jgi:hypothetical protein
MTPLTREEFLRCLNYADDTYDNNHFSTPAQQICDHDAALREQVKQLRDALVSIERNTCCEQCNEAALVARNALYAQAAKEQP